MSLANDTIDALRAVLGDPGRFLPLHEPTFTGNEGAYVAECVETGWVSTAGKFVDRFEEELAEFCDVPHAVACSNGTAALHVSLLLAGVGRDDEVLVPALTFVATANAVAYLGAVPHFVEVEEATLGIDPDALDAHLEEVAEIRDDGTYNRSTGARIAALVPMHCFGFPVRIDELITVAKKWGIVVVEDAAESLGSYYKGRHTAGDGLLSAISFNGNKVLTTGGGGAILTRDADLATRAKHLTTTAKTAHPWEYIHDETGYNFRLPNLNAALGVGQLEQLPKFLKTKRELARRYQEAFSGVDGLRFIEEPAETESNYWLCALLLDEGREDELEPILEATNGASLMTRPAWRPMHRLAMYENAPRADLSVTENLARRLLNIPSGPTLLGDS